jgi:Dyp-type peroxidase family
MARAKYYEGIEAAQAKDRSRAQEDFEPFNFASIGAKNPFQQFISDLTREAINWVYAFSRRFKPLLPLAGLLHVTREKQVREILERPEDFHTPFGPEMSELGGGATFLLGLEGEPHDRMHLILRQVIKREDAGRIGDMSRDFTTALLANSAGQIDVISDLIKRVPSEICLRYFGLKCDDVDGFGDWTMALSAFLFGDPFGKPEVRKLAMNARHRLTIIIDDAMARHQRLLKCGALKPGDEDTLVARLVMLQASQPVSDKEIRAILMGLATGFVPTNTLAASNMLMELLKRKDAMASACRAANLGDGAAMNKIVLEAGRLNPALAPGQWRYCPKDTTIQVNGKSHVIKAGTTLLVSTMSALRDPRAWNAPTQFRLDRSEPDLVFGVGPHACLGKHLALAQISALFEVLLKQPRLKPAKGRLGRLTRIGPFPRSLTMSYETPASQQQMFLIIAPVGKDHDKKSVDEQIKALGNPARDAMKEALDATGIVHFCSLATIDADEGCYLIMELSCDGDIPNAVRTIVAQAGKFLAPVFANAGYEQGQSLGAFMMDHVVNLHGKPWGANGLNYNGLSEFPVQQVEKQARFADFAGRVLRDYVATETARGSHPMLTLAHMRKILRQDAGLKAEATPSQLSLMQEAKAEGYDAFSLLTNSTRLKLAKFKPVSVGQSVKNFLFSKDGLIITAPLLVAFVVCFYGFWQGATGLLVSKVFLTIIKALVTTLLAAGTIVGLFLAKLRHSEKTDPVDTTQAPLDKIRAIVAQENPMGFAQNHILAVGTMKPGWFRAFTHALALWGIRVLITYGFRPGFVINMGTIHYARWWRLPGTNKVAFYSNFDGSWESYLEDFITRARQGQTAVWSNWQGFPKTKFLIQEGARDSDAFKRWVRIQQQLVPFWYARFPELTADQIRANALIHSGVGLARSMTESEEWLRCFGSMPRMENRIESDEVQALVFRGMKRLPYARCLAIELPSAGEALGEWLCWVRGRPMTAQGLEASTQLKTLIDEGIVLQLPRPEGRQSEFALAHSLTIAFGDRPLTGQSDVDDHQSSATTSTDPIYDLLGKTHQDARAAASHAVFIGLSAAGIGKFATPNTPDCTLLDGFPYAFRMGMAARHKINGDVGEDAPPHWRWNDDSRGEGATEAVLMLYAATPTDLDRMADIHTQLLGNHGGRVFETIDCAPVTPDTDMADVEHFGYRDGISQPVIKGTSRSTLGVPARDIAEPGEFILGYKNGAGYYPSTPMLPVRADVSGALPVVAEGNLSRFPDFGDARLTDGDRDFGRNGSFLVVRELKQDVETFNKYVDSSVEKLNSGGYCDLYKLVGQFPDQDWVKAKLMGRWPDGRPLVGHPVKGRQRDKAAEMENDFSYGDDDAQGLACPFGAHVRRTNPRDSKQPGDKVEQTISNRHRILRRGRSYTRSDGEKGLLFACLCTDIERQFEFVQQFWANAPAFHGLDNEPDPFIGCAPADPKTGEAKNRVFTIPTSAGPIQLEGLNKFVQTMGGGYFFLPSRSALSWLTDVALHSKESKGLES